MSKIDLGPSPNFMKKFGNSKPMMNNKKKKKVGNMKPSKLFGKKGMSDNDGDE